MVALLEFSTCEDRAGTLIEKDAFFECKEVLWGVVGTIRVRVRFLGPCGFFSLACSSRVSAVALVSGVNILGNQSSAVSGQEVEDIAN